MDVSFFEAALTDLCERAEEALSLDDISEALDTIRGQIDKRILEEER